MRAWQRKLVALITLGAVAPCGSIALAAHATPDASAATGGTIEGRLLDVDSRPAAGHLLLLLDPNGVARSRAWTDGQGWFTATGVPCGSYALAVRLPDGTLAPLAGPPLRLVDGARQRCDLKLLRADPAAIDRSPAVRYGFGDWWSGLPGGMKAVFVVGVVAAVAIGVSAFDSGEKPASPTE